MPAAPRRIALVRMDNLGDHVLGSGVIRALRSHWPSSELVAFVPRTVSGLYKRCKELAGTVPLPPASEYLRSEATFTALMQTLQPHGVFDMVVNPRFAEDWYGAAMLCRALADRSAIARGSGRVLGFRQALSPVRGFDPNSFYSELLVAPDTLHNARYAAIIAAAAIGQAVDAPPEVWFDPPDWERLVHAYALASRRYIVVGLGASYAYKRPSLVVYRQVVKTLLSRSQRIVLIGTEEDRLAAQALSELASHGDQVLSTCGRLQLFELAALLSQARLYIGPDAGPKHLAAACGTAVLEIAWVPSNYPARSRGPGTGGACWTAWQTLSRVVWPAAEAFATAAARPGFQGAPIGGIDPSALDQQLTELLALTALDSRHATRPPAHAHRP